MRNIYDDDNDDDGVDELLIGSKPLKIKSSKVFYGCNWQCVLSLQVFGHPFLNKSHLSMWSCWVSVMFITILKKKKNEKKTYVFV